MQLEVTLNELLVLAEGLVMWCGSVCKDWSPMSSQSGFSGKWMPLFGVMIGLVRLLKPRCFFHENSSKFDSSVGIRDLQFGIVIVMANTQMMFIMVVCSYKALAQ